MQATASARSADLFCDHLTLFLETGSLPVRDCVKFPGIWKRSVEVIQLLQLLHRVAARCSKHLEPHHTSSYIIIHHHSSSQRFVGNPWQSFFQTFCTAGSGLQDPQLEACSCPISVEGCEGANMCQCVCSFVCLPACLSVCLFVCLL